MRTTSTAHMRNPSAREVLVTGIGLALPGVATYGDLLGPLPGEGGFDPATGLRGREMRHKDRASRLALRAAESALHDAGLTDANATFTDVADSTAVVVSTNLGNVDSVCEAADTITREGVRASAPWACHRHLATSSPAGWPSATGCAAPTSPSATASPVVWMPCPGPGTSSLPGAPKQPLSSASNQPMTW
ncbi:hypothetical protein QFZ68_000232 [Streptomyces sp. V1I6]|nr:hypothetical protein [Streptomyces sp. V1I6]